LGRLLHIALVIEKAPEERTHSSLKHAHELGVGFHIAFSCTEQEV
jgi:hypothetical protein